MQISTLVLSATVFDAYTQSDFFGKMIFWGLFFLSTISWVVMFHKISLMRKLKSQGFQCEKFFENKEDRILQLSADKTKSFYHPYFVLHSLLKEKTLQILNKNLFFLKTKGFGEKDVYLSIEDISLLESHMQATIAQQSKFLEKNLFILSTVVTLGPFLGLLGTVWGILLTFSHLQTHTISSTNALVLSGLSMALGSTVVGLVVAIPALAGFNYLKSSIREFTSDMENFSHRLLAALELQYRKSDIL